MAEQVIRKFASFVALAIGLLCFEARLADVAGAGMKLQATTFESLSGWPDDDHSEALSVFATACRELTTTGTGFSRTARLSGTREDWTEVCRLAGSAARGGGSARLFFEKHFVPVRAVSEAGHFTGYFEPEVQGSLKQSARYPVPVLARPNDLVSLSSEDAARVGLSYGRVISGKARAYYTRREIEQGALADRGLEIAWLKSWADLFFMQVQGSGRVRLSDGSTMRLAYAAKSGLPYTSIGKVLIDKGEMSREGMSMQALRAWLDSNPDKARELMWQNQSYVFFRKLEDTDPSLGPVGAQKLPLTPLRSLAADRSYWALGVPVWVSTRIHNPGSLEPFNRLMVVQDTGSAIRGPQRGDIFFGTGDAAGVGAGKQDEPGELIAILPAALARRLLGQTEQ
jgi:membrane-bound lytic murein transglycosylase A